MGLPISLAVLLLQAGSAQPTLAAEPRPEAVIDAAQSQAQLRTSRHRASQEYRHEMVAVLLRRVLQRAVERARQQE